MNNIFGIGTDIVDISRIKKLINKNKRFKSRIFSKHEIKYCEARPDKIASYSKRFAAKEAFSKALGTGIGREAALERSGLTCNKNGVPFDPLPKLNLSLKF